MTQRDSTLGLAENTRRTEPSEEADGERRERENERESDTEIKGRHGKQVNKMRENPTHASI